MPWGSQIKWITSSCNSKTLLKRQCPNKTIGLQALVQIASTGLCPLVLLPRSRSSPPLMTLLHRCLLTPHKECITANKLLTSHVLSYQTPDTTCISRLAFPASLYSSIQNRGKFKSRKLCVLPFRLPYQTVTFLGHCAFITSPLGDAKIAILKVVLSPHLRSTCN